MIVNDRELVNIFYKVAFPLGTFLLVASLTVHLVTFAPFNIQRYVPFIFFLHIGIFLLLLPLIFIDRVLKKSPSMAGFDNDTNLPDWIWVVCFVLAGYVAFNFIYFLVTGDGNPETDGSRFWLENHGAIVRDLTREEYDAELARILHGFSGHWLVFYFYIACASYFGKKSFSEKISAGE
jgi:hypothetical protein